MSPWPISPTAVRKGGPHRERINYVESRFSGPIRRQPAGASRHDPVRDTTVSQVTTPPLSSVIRRIQFVWDSGIGFVGSSKSKMKSPKL